MRHIHFVGSWTVIAGDNYPSAEILWRTNGVRWALLRDTGQPNVMPNPNVCAWEAWVEDAGVTLLEADPANYTVLLDEDAGGVAAAVSDEKLDAATKTKIETFLKAKGVPATTAATLCKKADANATHKQIADAVIGYCNKLPKAKSDATPKILTSLSRTRASKRTTR